MPGRIRRQKLPFRPIGIDRRSGEEPMQGRNASCKRRLTWTRIGTRRAVKADAIRGEVMRDCEEESHGSPRLALLANPRSMTLRIKEGKGSESSRSIGHQ